MEALDINYQLAKHGTSQSSIATILGVNPQTVNNVIHGRTPSKRIRKAISKAIRKPVAEVFPETASVNSEKQHAA